VLSAGGGVVRATTVSKTLGLPQSTAYTWSCTAAGRCGLDAGFQFWVDAADPVASVTGQSTPLAYDGTATVTDEANHHTYAVGLLHYQNATGTVRQTIAYQKSTGLVIEHSDLSGLVLVILWYYKTGPLTSAAGGA